MKLKDFKNLIYTFGYYYPYRFFTIKIPVQFHEFKKRLKKKKNEFGVNIIGYPKGDFGIGQHMRLVTQAFIRSNLQFSVINSILPGQTHTDNTLTSFITDRGKYSINLFCMNAPQLVELRTNIKNDIHTSQYNIGYGYWELSIFPRSFRKQFKYLDEIWAPSKFIYNAIKKTTNKPVYYMPIPVDFSIPSQISRKTFNLPADKFLFIFSFDMSSYIDRKNPSAIIRCFIEAFDEKNSENVGLVIKCHRLKGNLDQENALNNLISQRKNNIYIIDELLDRENMLGLINCCDVYVSLHRSEGFGLGLAEAMFMGKNVIGTNYSGNCDFMKDDNSCLVPYTLIPVEKGQYPYSDKNSVWAEPDLDVAIKYMQLLYNDVIYRKKLSKNAQEYIKKYHSFAAIAKKYELHINQTKSKLKEKIQKS
ncbi:glycosyltransferase family 4 protein [Candidatus Lokiarchaeum ossiferum]